jgi:hypothetical protein
MNKIRKNDEVIVLTGKDKGKRGVVLLASGPIMLSWRQRRKEATSRTR